MAEFPRDRRKLLDLRWTQLETEFSSWRGHYDELSRYLLPRNGRFVVQDRNRGTRKHNQIYDNTATRAVRVVGAGLMAGATSPARPWVRIVASDQELRRAHAVRRWTEDVTQLVLLAFAKSNVYRVLHQTYEELPTFGTGAILLATDFETILHAHPLTCGEYRFAQDWKGRINTCFRRFERTVAEVVGEFGLDACSAHVQNAYRQGNLGLPIVIVHAIEPREDRDQRKRDAVNMPWASCYYEEGSNENRVLRESGYERFPVLAPRWSVAGGDVYGHGPGMEALGDVKQLQHQQLRKAQAIDFQANPPLQAPTELKNRDTNFLPGGVTFTDTAAQGGGVRPAFEVNLQLDHLLIDIQDVRERIRSSFFADLFLMLAQSPPTSRMTATEVAERHEEKLIQLGPVLERLHTELLEPLVRFTFETMLKGGLLPPAPPELVGANLSLEFTSVLAQAQRAVGVTGLERALGIAAGVANLKPEIVDNIDGDGIWSEITDMIGVSPRVSVDPREREQIRSARAAAQNAKEQAAMMEQSAGSVQKLAAAPTTGDNALSDVLSLFSGYDQPAPRNLA